MSRRLKVLEGSVCDGLGQAARKPLGDCFHLAQVPAGWEEPGDCSPAVVYSQAPTRETWGSGQAGTEESSDSKLELRTRGHTHLFRYH